MAKGKDPAFLFYPADASEDTQFMNRLERGCYFDLLKAHKKFRKFTLALIQKVLGQDFGQCWPAIEAVLEKDGDLYFIGWVNSAIENRAEHSAKQQKRIKEYWDKKKQAESNPEVFRGITTEQPKQESGITLESENAIANENALNKIELPKIKNVPRATFSKLALFSEMFSDEIYIQDLVSVHRTKDLKQAFEEMYVHHSNAPNPPVELWEWKQKLNSWLINTKPNGTSKRSNEVNGRREAFAKRHSSKPGG